jgi:hypothetical protein
MNLALKYSQGFLFKKSTKINRIIKRHLNQGIEGTNIGKNIAKIYGLNFTPYLIQV